MGSPSWSQLAFSEAHLCGAAGGGWRESAAAVDSFGGAAPIEVERETAPVTAAG